MNDWKDICMTSSDIPGKQSASIVFTEKEDTLPFAIVYYWYF